MKKTLALLVVLLLLFALLTTALSACAPPELRGNVLRFGEKDLKALPLEAQLLSVGEDDVTVFASQQELDDFFSQYTRLSSDVLGDGALENNLILLVARCDDADYDVEYTSLKPHGSTILYCTLTPRANKKPTLYLDVVLLPKEGRLAAVTPEELQNEIIYLANDEEEVIFSDYYRPNLFKFQANKSFPQEMTADLLSFLEENGNGQKFYAMDVVNMRNLNTCCPDDNNYNIYYNELPLSDDTFLSTSWSAFYTANGEPFTYKATLYPIPGVTPEEKLTYEQVSLSHRTGTTEHNRIIYVYSGADRFAEITYYARHVLPTSYFAKLIDNYLITIG